MYGILLQFQTQEHEKANEASAQVQKFFSAHPGYRGITFFHEEDNYGFLLYTETEQAADELMAGIQLVMLSPDLTAFVQSPSLKKVELTPYFYTKND